MSYLKDVIVASDQPDHEADKRAAASAQWFYRAYLTRYAGWSGFFVFFLLSLACSAGDLIQRSVAIPEPTRMLVPTFTSTPSQPDGALPQIIITPPNGATPGVIIIPEGMDPSLFVPTLTPTPLPPELELPGGELTLTPAAGVSTTVPGEQPQPFPTDTLIPTNTPEPTFTATPTPFAIVESGFVTLRTGPGVDYPLVAQLGPQIPIAIIGQSFDGSWYQLCCVNGGTVWVASTHVRTMNDASGAPQAASNPPPEPTPTPTYTPTPTVTPTATATLYPFDRSIGPLFFSTQNEFLTIWVELFVGTPPNEDPAPGYYLKVLFEGIERPPTNGVAPSANDLYKVGVPGTGYSNLSFNLKYEYRPPDPNTLEATDPNRNLTRADLIGTGTWRVYVVDGAGNQLSDVVEFRTEPSNPNREVYIAWVRLR